MPTAQQVIPMPSTATEDWQRRQLQQHQQPPPPQTHAHAPCLTPVAPADIAAEMPKAFWNISGAADVIPDPHARPAPATAPPVTPLLAYATAELGSAGPVAAQAPADDSDTSFEALQRRLAALKAPSAPAASNDEGDGNGLERTAKCLFSLFVLPRTHLATIVRVLSIKCVVAALPSDDEIAARMKHLEGEGDGPAVTDEDIAEHFENLTGRRPVSHPSDSTAAGPASSSSVDGLIASITEEIRIEATHEGGGNAVAGGGAVGGVPGGGVPGGGAAAVPHTADQLVARWARLACTHVLPNALTVSSHPVCRHIGAELPLGAARFTLPFHCCCSVAAGLGVSLTAPTPASTNGVDDAADPGPAVGQGNGEAVDEESIGALIARTAAELHIDLTATEATEANTVAGLLADANAELAAANEHMLAEDTKEGGPPAGSDESSGDTIPSASSTAALQMADGLLR